MDLGAASALPVTGAAGGVGRFAVQLAALAGAHRLHLQIGWRGPWDRAPEAAEALLSRRVRGKAVLELPPYQASA